MKCPQCLSSLNLKDLVPIGRFAKIDVGLCAFCGGFAQVDAAAEEARVLPACASCGAPCAAAQGNEDAHCAPCRDLPESGERIAPSDAEAASRILKEVLTVFPAIGAEECARYFQEVLEVLGSGAGCERSAFRFAAVSGLGAKIASLPGGAIVAGRELLEELEDEAMLAFVLARELAHQQSGRVYRRYRERRPLGPLSTGIDWGLTILTAGALSLDGGAPDVAREVATLGYGPGHEQQADEWAIKLLEATGYDETAAVRYLGLHEKRHLEARGALATFLEARPVRSRRRCLVETLVTLERRRSPAPRTGTENYRRAVDRLREEEFAPRAARATARSEPQA